MLLSKITGINPERNKGRLCKEILIQDRFVGIEFEVENYKVSGQKEMEANLLEFKSDGSLRGDSREVVTVPVSGEDVVLAIKQYLSLLNPEASTSTRCGLHVHVDMRECTVQQLINVLCTYCIVEDIMFKFCGSGRYGNMYCVPLNDTIVSNNSFWNLLHSSGEYITYGIDGTTKYSALNILPLRKYGTVEFRAHEGTTNEKDIIKWVNLVLLVVDHGIKFGGTSQNMVDMICASPERLLQNIFKDYYGTVVQVQLRDMDEMLRNGRNFQQYLIQSSGYLTGSRVEEVYEEEETGEPEEMGPEEEFFEEEYPEEEIGEEPEEVQNVPLSRPGDYRIIPMPGRSDQPTTSQLDPFFNWTTLP